MCWCMQVCCVWLLKKCVLVREGKVCVHECGVVLPHKSVHMRAHTRASVCGCMGACVCVNMWMCASVLCYICVCMHAWNACEVQCVCLCRGADAPMHLFVHDHTSE